MPQVENELHLRKTEHGAQKATRIDSHLLGKDERQPLAIDQGPATLSQDVIDTATDRLGTALRAQHRCSAGPTNCLHVDLGSGMTATITGMFSQAQDSEGHYCEGEAVVSAAEADSVCEVGDTVESVIGAVMISEVLEREAPGVVASSLLDLALKSAFEASSIKSSPCVSVPTSGRLGCVQDLSPRYTARSECEVGDAAALVVDDAFMSVEAPNQANVVPTDTEQEPSKFVDSAVDWDREDI